MHYNLLLIYGILTRLIYGFQLVTNICATLAVLAILFNVDHLTDIGDHLRELKEILRYVEPKVN